MVQIAPCEHPEAFVQLYDAMMTALAAYREGVKNLPDVAPYDYEPRKRSYSYTRTGVILQDGQRSAPGTREALPTGASVPDAFTDEQRVLATQGTPPMQRACIRGRWVSLVRQATGLPILWRSFDVAPARDYAPTVEQAEQDITDKRARAHILRLREAEQVQRDKVTIERAVRYSDAA